MTTFEIKARFEVSLERVFNAWLDSDEHSAMTGGAAVCTALSDEEFSAWDGYISGKNLKIVPHTYIKQSWRTTEFDENDASSIVEIRLKKVGAGCEVTLKHKDIPDGQPDYNQGWQDHYLIPMEEYFG
ncbi:MAG: activator of HSP90 ATPase [Verrucomicrobiales bacterium]|jgi:activator of HSP90 ATPase